MTFWYGLVVATVRARRAQLWVDSAGPPGGRDRRARSGVGSDKLVFMPAIVVVETNDVVISEVFTVLYFDEHRILPPVLLIS